MAPSKPLDLYCLSQSLIPQPKDWPPNHQITGFLTVPASKRATHMLDKIPESLATWLAEGERPADLPQHKHLFVAKYVNHEVILP